MIEDLKAIKNVNIPVKGTFLITNCEYKPFKNKDGYFLSCVLSDRTGTLKGIVWDNAELMKAWLKNKMVINLTGELTRYNDVPQIVIKGMKENKEDFKPSHFVRA